MEVLDVDKLN